MVFACSDSVLSFLKFFSLISYQNWIHGAFLFCVPIPPPLLCLLASSIGQLQEDLTSVNIGKKKKESDGLLILCVKERHGLGHRAPCSARPLDEWQRGLHAGRTKGGKQEQRGEGGIGGVALAAVMYIWHWRGMSRGPR